MDGQNSKDIYSTLEVKTNKVWIDGKPIYRRCLKITADTNISTGASVSGVTSTFVSDIAPVLDTLVSFNILGSNHTTMVAQIDTTNGVIVSNLTDGTNYVRHYVLNNGTYIFFEYTKTTD